MVEFPKTIMPKAECMHFFRLLNCAQQHFILQVRTLRTCAPGSSLSGWSYIDPHNTGQSRPSFCLGPFQAHIQRRWKKPTISAQQYIEMRTRDLPLERLMDTVYKKMKIIMRIQELVLRRREQALAVHLLGKWKNKVGLKKPPGMFLKQYPHIFEVYNHPIKQAPWFRVTNKALDLIEEEKETIRDSEPHVVETLRKLLMMSTNRSLEIHTLGLVTRQFGFAHDFKDSILVKYPQYFRLIDDDKVVELVSWDSSLAVAQIEKWREEEYSEKWLNESETKYAFKLQYPTGFKIQKGFKEKMKNWQRLSYSFPYENVGTGDGGGVLIEKRAVGIIHELLSLTVEKMIEVERIFHFRKPYSMELNIRNIILEHPGIFYLSTKDNILIVFLREAYIRCRLIESNPVYAVRKKLMDLIRLRYRNARKLSCKMVEDAQATLDNCKTEGENHTESEVTESGGDYDNECDNLSFSDTTDSSEDRQCEEWDGKSDFSEDGEDAEGTPQN